MVRVFVTLLWAVGVPVAVAESLPAAEQGLSAEDKDWADTSHDYVADSANRLVQWMDDFYGTENADFESASSRIRLRFSYGYDELDKGDFKTRVRAKVQLPKLSKRLALVVEGDDDDDIDRIGPGVDDGDSQLGLQYKFGESGRSRLDGIFSINSSADLRGGVRYRYDGERGKAFHGRFVQDLAYQTGDRGAFTRTRADGYRRIDDDNLLAWINRVEYGEDTYGVEWRSSVQWRHRLERDAVISYMFGLDGVTDPDPLTENYGFALNYRRNVFRKYVFAEIEPAYMWRKQADFDSRTGVWAINVRLEIHFEKKQRKDNFRPDESGPEDPSSADPLAWSGATACPAGCR